MANKKFVAKNGIAVGTGHTTTDVIDQDGHITANTVTISGTLLNATAFAGTANNASYLEGSNGSYYTGYSDNKAANAYSNATTYASNASNITTGTLTANVLATSGVTANTYGNSSSIPVITIDDKGRITSATTNAVAGVTGYTYTPANSTFIITTGAGSTFPATITTANDSVDGVIKVVDSVSNVSIYVAASANSVKTAYDNATTAYSNAATYADNKAANAYSNAVSYAGTIAGTAYSNATTFASSAAATAYSNAVSAASSSAATAYSNATTFAANATNISIGTLAEARLPFRMDQNVRTNDSVSFGNMTITGNLTVTGTTVTVNANNLSVQDNMIYLNSNSSITNPDLGIAGNYNDGTYRHAGFFRDASDGVWKVFDQYLPEPDASPYIDTANASFRIANFQANVVTAASFSGNGASVTSVDAATVGGNTAGTLRSYSDSTAATAYSNATSYAATIAGTAYSNATSYAATIAGTAYTNATSFASSAAATAYSNATSYASSIAATAYSNAVSYFTTNSANSAIGITYNFIQNTDLNGTGTTNALTSFNAYFPSGGGYNQPVGGGQHFRILQFGRYNTTDSNYWRGQIAQSFYEDRMWFRKEYSTTWGSWQELWHTGNDGSGSGLDADLLDGLNQTTSATASTIVARDSGGDITGRYFFGVHFNQSSSNSENPTIAAFWTNSGSDNYCRKSTPAHVISQLGLWTSSNDGSGSGLDADLLDGLSSGSFMRSAGTENSGTIIIRDNRSTTNYYNSVGLEIRSADQKAIIGLHRDGYSHCGISHEASNQLRFNFNSGDAYINAGIATVWGSGNDGSGSGLDADTLDGQQGSYYAVDSAVVKLADTQTITGTKTFSGAASAPFRLLATNSASDWDAVTFQATTEWGDGSAYGVLGGDSSDGIMMRRPHVVWNSVHAAADIRLGRSGGTSGGAWVNYGIKGSNVGFIGYENTNVLTFSGTSSRITAVNGVDAPIFYDSNNTAYYMDPAGTSNQYATLNIAADGSTGYVASRVYLRSHDNYRGAGIFMFGTGSSWFAGTPYTDFSGQYMIGRIASAADESVAQTAYRLLWIDSSGNAFSSASMRAPIFYDSNDTTYYVNPASFTNLYGGMLMQGDHGSTQLKLRLPAANNGATTGLVQLQMWCSEPGNSWDGAGFGYNVDNNLNESGNIPVYYFGRPNTSFGQAYMRMTTDGNWYFYNTPNSSNTRYLTLQLERTGYAIAPQSMRSPIFYDSDNTAYYIDPNTSGTSIRVGGYAYFGIAIDGDGVVINHDQIWTPAGTFHIQYSGAGNIDMCNGGGYAYVPNTSMRAPIFYDYNNTGYYVDANSTGASLNIAGSVNAATYNKPGLLVNSSGTSSSGAALAIQQVTSEGWTGIFVDYEPYTGWGLYHDNPNNYFCVTAESSTGNLRSFTVPSRVSGNRTAYEKIRFDQNDGSITAGGNITAYSDVRVKENIETVSSALEKTLALRGVTFTKKDETSNRRYLGVIAQEVEQIIPEVVFNADINDPKSAKTVAYGNMVGLLIEAIKEQQKQIEELKAAILNK